MRLLLLEDDPILGEGLRDFLQAEGHVVDWCQRLLEVRGLLQSPYDALLIDWQLPDGSGVDLVKGLRRAHDERPMLILTARDRLDDRLHGLDAGADDYLVKPFEPEELVARIEAIRRRQLRAHAGLLHWGDLEVDLKARAVFRTAHGVREAVELTSREWHVLEALVTRRGRVVSRADLEHLVLGLESQAVSNVLEVHVASLRRKLGRDLIETVRGLGYRMQEGGAP
ncbi:MAG: hypothetical protein RLZZ182_621 [Pseudomonadota bacterium]